MTRIDITADPTMLTSDQAVRDEQLQSQAIETKTYPHGDFRPDLPQGHRLVISAA